MKRAIATLTAGVALWAMAPSAHAAWYMSKASAQDATRQAVQSRYGFSTRDVAATCRPAGERYVQRRRYHRWTCRWEDVSFYPEGEQPCAGGRSSGGVLRITGASRGYRVGVVRGIACR